MVETDRKGFEATKLKNKLGLRASDTAEISLSDVRVPKGISSGRQEEDSNSLWLL